MKNSYQWRAILLTGLLFALFSCDKEEFTNEDAGKNVSGSELSRRGDEAAIVYGPDVSIGAGVAHSWISFNKFQIPVEIGVEITPEVFNDLPVNSGFEKSTILPLDDLAKERTPFNHIEIRWSPENYSALDGFKVPHFDFLFFMITEEERSHIPPWSDETEVYFGHYPPKNYMPVDYAPTDKGAGSYEFIGRYWLPMVPENETLEHTMSLGTYDGAFIFINPVSSLEFLKSNNKVTHTFSQPVFFQLNKLFPREYNIYMNDKGNYCVSLGNFIRR